MKPEKRLCYIFCLPFWPWPCENNNRIWNVFEQPTDRHVFVKILGTLSSDDDGVNENVRKQ